MYHVNAHGVDERMINVHYYYLSLHCHYQNDSCIKMEGDESQFNVSFIVRDEITRQCPQTTNLFEEKGEPKRNRTLHRPFCFTSLTPYRSAKPAHKGVRQWLNKRSVRREEGGRVGGERRGV